MSKRVLVVDDSMYMRTLIKDALIKEGFEIAGEAPNGESAIDLAMELKPDLITLDNILPDMIGTSQLNYHLAMSSNKWCHGIRLWINMWDGAIKGNV